jgi:hypothetical protein
MDNTLDTSFRTEELLSSRQYRGERLWLCMLQEDIGMGRHYYPKGSLMLVWESTFKRMKFKFSTIFNFCQD